MTQTGRTRVLAAMALLCAAAGGASQAQQLHQYTLDQQVRGPSPTMTLMFNLNPANGFTIDSMTIYVDGTAYHRRSNPAATDGWRTSSLRPSSSRACNTTAMWG